MKKNFYEINGLALIEKIKALGKEATKYVKGLSKDEKKSIVLYFLENQSEISNAQIGLMLSMTGQNVGIIKKNLLKDGIKEIEEIDVKILASALTMKKNEFQVKSIKSGNINLAWKIEMDYIEKMQSLGFIYKKPEAYKHSIIKLEFGENGYNGKEEEEES